jgi:hypothetical protein
VAREGRGTAQHRLAEIVAYRPASAPLQNLLGERYLSAGQMDQARKAFEAASSPACRASFKADRGIKNQDIRQIVQCIQGCRGECLPMDA